MNFNEKVRTMLSFNLDYTLEMIERIVNENEPEESAVTANKLLILYIDLMKEIDEEFKIEDVKSLILDSAYDEAFYNSFEKKRKKELVDYFCDTSRD